MDLIMFSHTHMCSFSTTGTFYMLHCYTTTHAMSMISQLLGIHGCGTLDSLHVFVLAKGTTVSGRSKNQLAIRFLVPSPLRSSKGSVSGSASGLRGEEAWNCAKRMKCQEAGISYIYIYIYV